jgi:hypothetical protein
MIKTFSTWMAAVALALPLAANAAMPRLDAARSASGGLASPSFSILASSAATLSYGAAAGPYSPAQLAGGNGYPAQSFLSVMQSGLAYGNVQAAANPAGALRGQRLRFAIVPELNAYAMMLAGLGLIGVMVGRRRRPY